MAQTTEYSKIDLRVGTEAQFNAKVDTLPAGTLFGVTDATVSKADLSTDLKNEINGKINKPANPTSDSAVVINSSGAISTKPLTSITSKSEVAVQGTTPTGDEILWINPNGTSGGGGSSGGGKLYRHDISFNTSEGVWIYRIILYKSDNNLIITFDKLKSFLEGNIIAYNSRGGELGALMIYDVNDDGTFYVSGGIYNQDAAGFKDTKVIASYFTISDTVTEV